jgi:O-antigen chain-terminating methyltransferase
LIDESLRALKPKGIVIFEAPNPENLTVGAYSFYTDPTHTSPQVPDTISFLLEQRGFCSVEIKRLHKYKDYNNVTSTNEIIDKWLYNEMDYSVIGYKA